MSIDIVFTEDGTVHIRTRGFKGKQCITEIEKIIDALKASGVEVKTEKITETEEMHQHEKVKQKTLEI
jgi:hypothetical protein